MPKDQNEIKRVRKHSNEVVRQVIAPAFAEKQKAFKGEAAKNRDEVKKVFHLENVQPHVETLPARQVIQEAQQMKQVREQKREQQVETHKQKIDQGEKRARKPQARESAQRSSPQHASRNRPSSSSNRMITIASSRTIPQE